MENLDDVLLDAEKVEITEAEASVEAEAILCGICPGSAAVGINAVMLCWNIFGLIAS